MEALALLCTLHADGPATLRRLRRAGCGSLEQLEAYEPEHLASLLEVAPAVARRLGKEARVLAGRLDPVFEDREEGGEQDAAPLSPPAQIAPVVTPEGSALSSPAAETQDPSGDQSGEVGGHLDLRDRKILGAVLDRWGATTPDEVPLEESASPETIPSTPSAPEISQAPESQGWVAGCVDGLDEATAARLTDLGIEGFEALAEEQTLSLAQDLGLPFAQVRRLQFLARQAVRLEAAEAATAIPIPDPVDLAPATPAPIEPIPEPAPEPIEEPDPEPAAVIELGPVESGPGELDSGGLDSGGLDPRPLELAATEPEIEAAQPEAREPRRFWEPRPFLGAPGEVADPVPLPSESEELAQRNLGVPRREGVALDWKFEVPRPPRRPEPEPLLEVESAESARVLEGEPRPLHEDSDAAGPFA